MVVYGDLLFVLNLVLDYAILLAAARITGRSFLRIRLLLAALIGAVYALVLFLPRFHFLAASPWRIACGCVIVAVAFWGNGNLLHTLLVFWTVSFVLGGGVLALAELGGATFPRGIASTGWDFIAVLLVGSLCSWLLSRWFSRTAAVPEHVLWVEVEVELLGKKTGYRALVDTGNTLTDGTNHPVLVTDWQVLHSLLPQLTSQLVHSPAAAFEVLTETVGPGRVRLLPYRTVGAEEGLMLAMRPDSLRVNGRVRPDILVGISAHRVSSGGLYHGLIGAIEVGGMI